ncbi:PAS domain S-box protein [Magnetococcales bacterium HHB-1]
MQYHTRYQYALLIWLLMLWIPAHAEVNLNLTPQEIAWLKKHPTIKLGIDIDWAPFEFIDNKKVYRGMAAEYMAIVEARLGIRFDIPREMPWTQVVDAVKRRELDAFSCVVKTPKRENFVSFTKPYLTFPMVIVTEKDEPFIANINELRQHKVAVVKGYASHDLMAEYHPSFDLQLVENVRTGLEAVSHGQAYAFIGNLAVVGQNIRSQGITNLKVSGQTPYRFELSMAVRKDWPLLQSILQKALNSITHSEKDKIYHKWMRVQFEQTVNYTNILIAASILLLIIAIILYWNRKLHSEVARRELVETNLEQSMKNLSIAQAIAHIGSWEWDIHSGAISWSKEIFRIFGFNAQSDTPTYERFLEAIHPNDRKAVQKEIDHALADPTHSYAIDHRVMQPCGEIRWVMERGSVTRDHAGKPIKMHGTVQDITEIRKAEEKLSLAHKVIKNAADSILITDHRGIIIDVNPAYEQTTGYAREEVIGQNPNITSSGRHPKAFYKQMWGQINKTGAWEGEVWDRRKNGEVFPKMLSINTIKDRDGEIVNYVGIFKDMGIRLVQAIVQLSKSFSLHSNKHA